MKSNIGNYAQHARFWDWDGFDHTPEHQYWLNWAQKYGGSVLLPMCALGATGAYMARAGMDVTAFDITPEMIAEGKKRFGDVPGLRLLEGDVTDFHFDIPPADFCFSMDFGHLLSLEDVRRALACIGAHLRPGGALVIETTLPPETSSSYGRRRFDPATQPYPGITVWKTGEGRFDAEAGRHYIDQTFYARDAQGETHSFDHAFYLQSYPRQAWLDAFAACSFNVIGEYNDRDVTSWQSGGDGFRIFEAVYAGGAA